MQKAKESRMVKTLAAAAAFVVPFAGMALGQDVEKGATLFKQCAVCHKIGPGATNSIGPELNGLDGRHPGSVANYTYVKRRLEQWAEGYHGTLGHPMPHIATQLSRDQIEELSSYLSFVK